MSMEAILKSLMSLSGSPTPGADISGDLALPGSPANPGAVKEFETLMQQGVNTETKIEAAPGIGNQDPVAAETMNQKVLSPDKTGSDSPATLGERLAEARANQPENSHTKQWLDTIIQILEKDSISHSDLYRVQVLAGMAQIETTRNASVNRGLDSGLKTLLKNS